MQLIIHFNSNARPLLRRMLISSKAQRLIEIEDRESQILRAPNFRPSRYEPTVQRQCRSDSN